MSHSFDQRAEKLSHLEEAPALALIFEWVKTSVINKAEFSGLVKRVLTPAAFEQLDDELEPDTESGFVK